MNRQIIDEAAEWFVEFSTGEVDEIARSDFDRWLRKSPEHVKAYLELLPIWADGATPLPEHEASAEDLIALARTSDNVVALSDTERARARVPADEGRSAARTSSAMPYRWWYALAASVTTLALIATAMWIMANPHTTYATELGQQRTVTLPDGSTVELNTQSLIRVNFTPQSREVRLLEGEALFKVAKDPLRPFMVSSDATRVRAVGTQFVVYRRDGYTTVTVVEGRVLAAQGAIPPTWRTAAPVLPEPAAAPSWGESIRDGNDAILVTAGEQLTFSPTETPRAQRADVESATAWTRGRLIFEATPLPEVAQEFNRYNERKIRVENEALAGFLVNGSFSSTNPASLVRFLQEQPALSIHETANEIRISLR